MKLIDHWMKMPRCFQIEMEKKAMLVKFHQVFCPSFPQHFHECRRSRSQSTEAITYSLRLQTLYIVKMLKFQWNHFAVSNRLRVLSTKPLISDHLDLYSPYSNPHRKVKSEAAASAWCLEACKYLICYRISTPHMQRSQALEQSGIKLTGWLELNLWLLQLQKQSCSF